MLRAGLAGTLLGGCRHHVAATCSSGRRWGRGGRGCPPRPVRHAALLERATEFAVLVSLFTAGLKLRLPPTERL